MLSACFPKYVALKDGDSYKLYSNTIYKSEETLNSPTNIFDSMVNLQIERVSKYTPTKEINIAYIRKWYGGMYNGCSWSYSGYEVFARINTTGQYILAPVILITRCCKDILPHGAEKVVPMRREVLNQAAANLYDSASLVTTDPYSPTNESQTNTHQYSNDIPIAPVAEEPPRSVMPAHVKRLIIADSVQRGEICPISSDVMTFENASTTSCGHVFTTVPLNTWLMMASSKGCCPVCKQKCTVA